MFTQTKIKWTNWLILILVVWIVSILFYFLGFQFPIKKPPASTNLSESQAARLILDFGNGQQRWFEGEVIDGMTMYDALSASALAGNLKLQVSPAGQLAAVDNLISNSNVKQWNCYLGNQKITNIKQQKVKQGEETVCRYE